MDQKRLRLALMAGARAIENNKRLHGAIFCHDVFGNCQELPYLEAAQVLRAAADSLAHPTDHYTPTSDQIRKESQDGTAETD